MGGFITSPSPSPQVLEDEGNSGDSDGEDDANKDEDASFSSDGEMTASQ